ncbi:MAG: helix-turn-helix domain-containing protein [Patescibacteria group bacterium]
MENKLINILINIGLTDKEAKVYLAALSLGPGKVKEIAQSAGVKRTTAYSILEALKAKGLIRVELAGWKTFYTAEGPDKLESLVEQMRHQVKDNLPEFSALYNLHSSGAFISYYEGLEAVKNVYEKLLRDIRPHEDYLVIGDADQWLNQDPGFFLNFAKKRAKLDINIRILMQDTPIAREHQKLEKIFNEQVKIMPPEYKLTTNMVIIPHRVVINQLTPPLLAMVIENDNIVQMNRELFEMIWKSVS